MELKPCPFCSDIPQPPTAYIIDDCWGVKAKIFCCVDMEGYAERDKNAPDRDIEVDRAFQEAIEKVTKQWNTRHQPEPVIPDDLRDVRTDGISCTKGGWRKISLSPSALNSGSDADADAAELRCAVQAFKNVISKSKFDPAFSVYDDKNNLVAHMSLKQCETLINHATKGQGR